MTDSSDKPKVVSLFSREPITRERIEAAADASVTVAPAGSAIDQRSVETLNAVIEEVLKGKCSGVCIFATGETGLGRYFISFPKGAAPQKEATRYLGQIRIFEGILEEIVWDGVNIEPGTAPAGGKT